MYDAARLARKLEAREIILGLFCFCHPVLTAT